MLSVTAFVPEEKLGIAVFTNKLPNTAYIILSHYLIEKFLGSSSQDWIQTYLDLEKEGQEKEEQAKKQIDNSRAKGTHPSLELEKYAGTYESAILGRATLSVDGSGLRIQLQAEAFMSGTLEHWHYDTFLCHWDDPVFGESLMPFITNGQGQVTEFRMKIRPDWIDPLEHVFEKTN